MSRAPKGYKVGYGRPPKASRFQPGQSGNPRGRPKGSRNIATRILQALEEKVVITVGGKKKTLSKLDAAFIQQSNRAASGDLKALAQMVGLLNAAEAVQAGLETGETVHPADEAKLDAMLLETLRRPVVTGGGDDRS
jgi:hypothetical protein